MKFVIHKYFQKLLNEICLIKQSTIKALDLQREKLIWLLKSAVKMS